MKLLAALFYFSEPLGGVSAGRVRGELYCRLPPNSEGANSLIAARPQFRLLESSMTGSAGDQNICDVRFTRAEGDRFDPMTLAAPVEFEVSAGQWRRTIEVLLPSRSNSWITISGF